MFEDVTPKFLEIIISIRVRAYDYKIKEEFTIKKQKQIN